MRAAANRSPSLSRQRSPPRLHDSSLSSSAELGPRTDVVESLGMPRATSIKWGCEGLDERMDSTARWQRPAPQRRRSSGSPEGAAPCSGRQGRSCRATFWSPSSRPDSHAAYCSRAGITRLEVLNYSPRLSRSPRRVRRAGGRGRDDTPGIVAAQAPLRSSHLARRPARCKSIRSSGRRPRWRARRGALPPAQEQPDLRRRSRLGRRSRRGSCAQIHRARSRTAQGVACPMRSTGPCRRHRFRGAFEQRRKAGSRLCGPGEVVCSSTRSTPSSAPAPHGVRSTSQHPERASPRAICAAWPTTSTTTRAT